MSHDCKSTGSREDRILACPDRWHRVHYKINFLLLVIIAQSNGVPRDMIWGLKTVFYHLDTAYQTSENGKKCLYRKRDDNIAKGEQRVLT